MKAFSGISFVVALVAIMHGSAMAMAGSDVSQDIDSSIRGSYSGTQIDYIRHSEIPGLYEMKMGANIAYTGPDGRYLLVGHIFDTQTGKDITQARLDAFGNERADMRLAWESLPLEDSIRSGKGVQKLAIFTDPQCPYCVKLEKELSSLQNIEVYTFLYPLASLHPQAVDIAKHIWCARDDAERLKLLRNYMLDGRKPPKKTCDTKAIERIAAFGEQNKFAGTPTLVRGDGAVIFGYRDAEFIRKWLAGGTIMIGGE